MKYENEMFQDLMGIVIETDDAWLNKKLNNHVCYKGGGGRQTTTATPLIPEEFKPFAKQYGEQLTSAAKAGLFGQIGPEAMALKQAQETALGRAGDVRQLGQAAVQAQQEALRGEGLFAPRDLSAQKEALASQAREQLRLGTSAQRAGASARGVLGSARQRLAQAKAEEQAGADLAGRFAELDAAELARRQAASAAARGETAAMQKASMADIDVLRGVGKEQTARMQMMAEQPTRGLKEMAGLFTGIPQGQTQTTTGGGGK